MGTGFGENGRLLDKRAGFGNLIRSLWTHRMNRDGAVESAGKTDAGAGRQQIDEGEGK